MTHVKKEDDSQTYLKNVRTLAVSNQSLERHHEMIQKAKTETEKIRFTEEYLDDKADRIENNAQKLLTSLCLQGLFNTIDSPQAQIW